MLLCTSSYFRNKRVCEMTKSAVLLTWSHHTQHRTMASKRLCPRPQRQPQISQDEWSHIKSFLFHDAFKSACDLASMSMVCRSWAEVVEWTSWSKAFGLFPLPKHFPSVLVPFMKCAKDGGGKLIQKSAIKHLKLTASTLKTVPHESIPLGYRRFKYLYKLEPLLLEATRKFGSIQNMELHIARSQEAAAKQEEKRLLKEERRLQVSAVLRAIGADYLLYDKEMRAYIDKGKGSLEAIRETSLVKKRIRDQKLAEAAAIRQRRSRVEDLASNIDLPSALFERNAIVVAYLHDDVGSKETVKKALQDEKEALRIRRRQFSESPAYRAQRRAELVQELESKGLMLRQDSRFCSIYISGETNASKEEVVATMKVTEYLFAYGRRSWSRWHSYLEVGMKRMIRTGEATDWYQACDRVIQESHGKIQIQIQIQITTAYDSDYDSDY